MVDYNDPPAPWHIPVMFGNFLWKTENEKNTRKTWFQQIVDLIASDLWVYAISASVEPLDRLISTKHSMLNGTEWRETNTG